MSATVTGAGVLNGMAPVSRTVRGYFAPVDRVTGTPADFDPLAMAGISPDAAPAPWIDLGPCRNFTRRSEAKVEALRAGAPLTARGQARTEAAATVEFEFACWSKLAMALSAGVEQRNLLTGAGPVAVMTADGASTATTLAVGSAVAAGFAVGSLVVVDVDYAGQMGYVGSGASGGYVRSGTVDSGDVDAIRRMSLNVGLVSGVADGVLTLAAPLLAGSPVTGMQVSRVAGFEDREGDGFLQEWSGLFSMEGEQGERMFFFYPRLQAMIGIAEEREALSGPLGRVRLKGSFRALAAKDASDGSWVVCRRSYLPAPVQGS